MRIDNEEFDIAQRLAPIIGCSTREVVELAVRILASSLIEGDVEHLAAAAEGVHQVRRIKRTKAMMVKALSKPEPLLTIPAPKVSPFEKPRTQKNLTYNPFKDLGKKDDAGED